MVATIEIGPHKAAHAAVVIDEIERVLDELTVSADRYQTARLAKWASRLDGDGRVWKGEAAQRGFVM
jgi:hypothetical protein